MLPLPVAADTAEAPDIALILSSDARPLRQAASGFKERLKRLCRARPKCPSLAEYPLTRFDTDLTQPPRLLVAIGTPAARRVLERYPSVRQLHLMVSQNRYHSSAMHAVSALFIEQPPARLLEFIRFLLPDQRRIGVLSTDQSRHFIAQLEQQARFRDLDLRDRMITASEHIGRELHTLNRTIDLLLAIPDSAIFNRRTLATILLVCYQDRIPVIGFSAGMTRAGALASLYTPPQRIGEEGAGHALQLLDGAPPFHRFPVHFEMKINRRVAQALHLRLPTDNELSEWREGMR